jgi:hypothetical protein
VVDLQLGIASIGTSTRLISLTLQLEHSKRSENRYPE